MQVVLVYLEWFWRNSLSKCVLQPKIAKKNSLKPSFWGSRSFKVIDVGTTGKLVGTACYDTQQVCVYLQPQSLSHLAFNPYRVVTDGRTDRIPIANTRSQQYLLVQLSRIKIIAQSTFIIVLECKASRPRPDLFEAKATIFCPQAVLEVEDPMPGCTSI